jgi:SAM-dependent methyltransferase
MNSAITVEALRYRNCPVCGEASAMAKLFLRPSFDSARLTSLSFASRKVPEFMSYELRRCAVCQTVFASEAPSADILHSAYRDADYDSAIEAEFAARVYRQYLEPELADLSRRGIALEVGTGTGAFLRQLQQLGFTTPIGIEPSQAAIDAAASDVKPLIRKGVFEKADFLPNTLSLICCFQTIEHLSDPLSFIKQAYELLEPNGMVAIVAHNYAALLNRVLGKRSPIIDIEHLQLFNPKSLTFLLKRCGFFVQSSSSIRNVYPLSYWTGLLPVGRKAVSKLLQLSRLWDIPVPVNVGNMLVVGTKGRSGEPVSSP